VSEAVERGRGRERKVTEVVVIGEVVQQDGEERNKEDSATEDVCCRPPWSSQWRCTDGSNDSPVESEKRETGSLLVAEEGVDNLVVGSNPRNPVELRYQSWAQGDVTYVSKTRPGDVSQIKAL
jgi:hypothetical protein